MMGGMGMMNPHMMNMRPMMGGMMGMRPQMMMMQQPMRMMARPGFQPQFRWSVTLPLKP